MRNRTSSFTSTDARGDGIGKARTRSRSVIKHVALIFLSLLLLFPLYWLLVSSFQPASSIFKTPPNFFPDPFTFENYSALVNRTNFPRWFSNSAIVAIAHVVTVVPVAAMAGYGFAKARFRWSRAGFLYVLAFMMVPMVVLVVPLYIAMLRLHWTNSYVALVIPWAASPFAIFLMRQWIVKIPDELLDAARVDGATELRIFLRIVCPLSMPAISTVVIIEFLWSWNNFLFPAIVQTDNSNFTLPVGLASLVTNSSAGERLYGPLTAGAVLTIIPVVVVFLVLQRRFVAGLIDSSGSKG